MGVSVKNKLREKASKIEPSHINENHVYEAVDNNLKKNVGKVISFGDKYDLIVDGQDLIIKMKDFNDRYRNEIINFTIQILTK